MQLVCEICGYILDEDELTEMCPVCGTPKSRFSEWIEKDPNLLTDETVDGDTDSFENDLYGDYEE